MSKIALGTVKFGMDYGINSIRSQVSPEEIEDLLGYAYLQGIDLLDTAPAYGSSEKILGSYKPHDFKIITKTRHFNCIEIGKKELQQIENDFFQSLKNLKKNHVYGLLIHNSNDLLKPGSNKLYSRLKDIKQKGLINKIGVSIYNPTQLELILRNYDIDIVQLPCNILDKRFVNSGMLAVLKDRGIEIHARSVFLQGLLLMSEHTRPKKFNHWEALWKIWHEWLNDYKISALEASIRHVISISEISKVLVGVDTSDQLKEIVIASDGALPTIPNELSTNDVNLLNPSNWGRL
ncbi:aldo/keto reductase [Candidatus Pseudothioglobus singularis]|nr:aldo/keto reductase [Candidatus Pseudothioglobus singularis]